MRLVAVSIVKNEADIIEAFVRHTLAWVDHLLVFDHDSTDGTRQILGALRQEGLALSLYTDDALGNLQQARSNYLTVLAAREFSADWILPLDADEILAGPGRPALEHALADFVPDRPVSLPLLNYYPTREDDASEANPVLRLRHCQSSPPRTRKIMVPRPLSLAAGVAAGKGSHALYRGQETLPAQPLPGDYHLAHLALRSPQHQMLRVTLAELQKLSRGSSHAGLDEHYRLGYQLLAESPDLFFATIFQPTQALRLLPITYQGGALRYGGASSGWNRVAMALLPYLEKLATSHGRLVDATGGPATEEKSAVIRELRPAELSAVSPAGSAAAFSGFVPLEGWGEQEGPVPEAFLPPFHWGYAPATQLQIHPELAGPADFVADALTYSEGQVVTVELNGKPLLQHAFGRVNQKERLHTPLTLRAGDNRLTLHYGKALVTDYDPRQLAAIFLSLQVRPASV